MSVLSEWNPLLFSGLRPIGETHLRCGKRMFLGNVDTHKPPEILRSPRYGFVPPEFLFLCGLYIGVISYSVYTASNEREISGRSGKKRSWPNLRHLPGRTEEGTGKHQSTEVQSGHLPHASMNLYPCFFLASVDRSNQHMLTLQQDTYTINRSCQNITSLLM